MSHARVQRSVFDGILRSDIWKRKIMSCRDIQAWVQRSASVAIAIPWTRTVQPVGKIRLNWIEVRFQSKKGHSGDLITVGGAPRPMKCGRQIAEQVSVLFLLKLKAVISVIEVLTIHAYGKTLVVPMTTHTIMRTTVLWIQEGWLIYASFAKPRPNSRTMRHWGRAASLKQLYSWVNARKDQQGRGQWKWSESRKRSITQFTPPFSRNFSTDIARKDLVDRHFLKGSDLHKIFNRNMAKVSYSCTPNVGTIIKRHNASVLNAVNASQPGNPRKGRNCGWPPECLLKGECLASDTVYQATVMTEGEVRNYIGSTATTFKARFGNPKVSMHDTKDCQTELSKYIWRLKQSGAEYEIDWKILEHAASYSSTCRS